MSLSSPTAESIKVTPQRDTHDPNSTEYEKELWPRMANWYECRFITINFSYLSLLDKIGFFIGHLKFIFLSFHFTEN